MDKIEKLLRKISQRDRERLLKIVDNLLVGKKEGLVIEKIVQTDFYRLKSGHYRIIFHYQNKEVIIDSIKLRNESTYKNL